MKRVASFVLGCAGCSGAGQDIETPSTSTVEAPDIAGTFDAAWTDLEGCEDVDGGWVDGPLAVSGAAGSLVYDFGEGAFDGSVDDTFTFRIVGTSIVDGMTVSLDGVGLAYLDAEEGWVLDGDLEMDSGEDCRMMGVFTAIQTSAGG